MKLCVHLYKSHKLVIQSKMMWFCHTLYKPLSTWGSGLCPMEEVSLCPVLWLCPVGGGAAVSRGRGWGQCGCVPWGVLRLCPGGGCGAAVSSDCELRRVLLGRLLLATIVEPLEKSCKTSCCSFI